MMSERFMALVMSFPVLRNYAPIDVEHGEIDLQLLDAWAAHDMSEETLTRILKLGRSPRPGDGARNAARFVLHLWHSSHPWKCGPFDLFKALTTWDDQQIAAFQAWAADPWRP